jgi:hypothetical protein
LAIETGRKLAYKGAPFQFYQGKDGHLDNERMTKIQIVGLVIGLGSLAALVLMAVIITCIDVANRKKEYLDDIRRDMEEMKE